MEKNIEFQLTDWNKTPFIEHKGETGNAYWQTTLVSGFRISKVEFSKNYKSDNWCKKGDIIYCIDGEMESDLGNDETMILSKGMSYMVSDEYNSYQASSVNGVILYILDGDFLKKNIKNNTILRVII